MIVCEEEFPCQFRLEREFFLEKKLSFYLDDFVQFLWEYIPLDLAISTGIKPLFLYERFIILQAVHLI
jgi:hypothetical protein